MKRLLLNISTTVFELLMTMGALDMLEKENFIVAGVFLFFSFWFLRMTS